LKVFADVELTDQANDGNSNDQQTTADFTSTNSAPYFNGE